MPSNFEFTFWPAWGWLAGSGVVLATVVFASYFWAKGRSGTRVRLTLGIIRWITLALVVFCLLDPEWVEAIKHQQRSRLAVLLDTSRSMSIKDLPQERLAAAKSWIQHELLPAVPAGFDVQTFTFQESLSPVATFDTAKAAGDATGLASALESVLSVPNDDPLTGVIVCSDGIENMRNDLEATARLYRRKGIPIHTVTVGTTNDMRDVIVENVQVRRAVPNQAPTKVAVTLRSSGYGQQIVPIQVLHDNQLVATQEARLTGGEQKIEIDFTPRQKGFQTYEVRVPTQPGEWLATNNRRLFGLEVIDPTIRVLYMEGTPQQPNSPIPEWKYLKSALESDPNIKVKTLYREFGANGKHLQVVDRDPQTGDRIYPVEHPTHGFPQTLAGLLEFDVVIHSDIRKESFTSEQLQNMARLVEEFGGGFVMIGGNSAFGKGGYHRTILDRIIPAAMQQEKDSQSREIQLHIAPAAWSHPIIALGRSRQETELIWTQKFPPLYGCNLVDRAKPGAMVLADDPSSPGKSGPRLLLAVQNVGQGRSMAFTSDTTRSWGRDFETLWGERFNPALPLSEGNCDSRYYRRFWANAIRWLAAARIGRTNNGVSLELAQSYCAPGQKVSARVKVRNPDQSESASAEVNLFSAAGGQTNLLAKATFDSAARCYVAEVALTNSGSFVLSAAAAIKGVPLGTDRQLLVCEAMDREMGDLRAKPELMARVAQLSGGNTLSFSEHDPSLAASAFYKAPPVTVDYRREPLWARSWWLGAILGLLSLEWALRRLNGMA